MSDPHDVMSMQEPEIEPSLQTPQPAGSAHLRASPRTNAPPVPRRSIQDLASPPKDLALMRQRLFEITERIELQPHEFERYWPYIDNVWVRQHKAGRDKTGRYITDYYACRLQRPTYTPKPDGQKKDGTPTRKKQIREGGTCQMRLKTIRYEGGYCGITILRVGDDKEHTHDLDHIDKIKRTSVLMEIARSEVMKGFMPASVFAVMNQDFQKLYDAGGKYLNRNDVRNASQNWRQDHKEELKVHGGYKYDHGNGIVRQTEDMAQATMNGEAPILDPALADMPNVLPPDTLQVSDHIKQMLEPYLPPRDLELSETDRPHVTLTYASSLDSSLTLAPGMQTHISGIESKAMTHYIRSRHDAIIIGVGTAIADNPALNCRLEGAGGYGGLGWEGQPRPIIIDPTGRWMIDSQSRIMQTVAQGRGRAPWIIISHGVGMDHDRFELLKYYGGKYFGLKQVDSRMRLRWEAILKALLSEGIKSVMIEGGGMVINDLLQSGNVEFVNSAIVTLAPTFLGKGGVSVGPVPRHDHTGRPQPVVRFRDVQWIPMGEDVVMCGRMPHFAEPQFPPSLAPPAPIAPVGGQDPAEGIDGQFPIRPGEQYGPLPT